VTDNLSVSDAADLHADILSSAFCGLHCLSNPGHGRIVTLVGLSSIRHGLIQIINHLLYHICNRHSHAECRLPFERSLCQYPNMDAPSIGNIRLASPSINTCGASGLILPHDIASLRRAPEREPSYSGAVDIPTAESSPPRY